MALLKSLQQLLRHSLGGVGRIPNQSPGVAALPSCLVHFLDDCGQLLAGLLTDVSNALDEAEQLTTRILLQRSNRSKYDTKVRSRR